MDRNLPLPSKKMVDKNGIDSYFSINVMAGRVSNDAGSRSCIVQKSCLTYFIRSIIVHLRSDDAVKMFRGNGNHRGWIDFL